MWLNRLLLIVAIASQATAANSIDLAAIKSLVGRQTINDGPNCYNATMIAKGFSSIISQTSDEELKYYLWNYCKRVEGSPRPGDILVAIVNEEQEVEHAAVYLGKGKIFEKLSLAGLRGKYSRMKPGIFRGNVATESRYSVIPFKTSYYFGPKSKTRIYRCKSTEEVKGITAEFEKLPEFKPIVDAKMVFSNIAFDPTFKTLKNYQGFEQSINGAIETIDHLSGREEKDIFLYAAASSVWINMANLHDGEIFFEDPDLKDLYTRLFDARILFAERIRDHHMGPNINFILGERFSLSGKWIGRTCVDSNKK